MNKTELVAAIADQAELSKMQDMYRRSIIQC